jgi:hypothetical protein
MAGLIFFWQGECVKYENVVPLPAFVSYGDVQPAGGIAFSNVLNMDIQHFTEQQPLAAVAYSNRTGGTTLYARRIREPVCKHE